MSQQVLLPPSTASEFLNNLNTLGCPYTQDVDEYYISELLLTSGEHRIRLLLWIFGKMHSSVEEMVNAQDILMRQGTAVIGVDKRIQLLTSLAASFGICRPEDLDLIRGQTSRNRQICFWKKVFSAVRPCSKSSHAADLQLMDAILHHEKNLVLSSVSEQLELVPHALKKEMMMLSNQKSTKHVGFSEVEEQLEKLTDNLKVQQKKLSDLENSVKYTSKDDKNTLNNVSCKLSLTLNDLDQMMTTFEQVFTNNFLPFCNKEKEEFGNLGPLVEIVKKQLSYIVITFDNLQNIMNSNDSILNCTKNDVKLSPVLEQFLSNSLNCLDELSQTMVNHSMLLDTGSELESNGRKINDTISNISTIK